ncbi:T9SS type A sorting domain-containing protein [Fibrella forsythiae]|uniref:T9SS type A sorting domain-containing protein n=1 Tax=Fibrella forsythiae TaxID=2817061 RepID=A0ABS3JG04_9BACT|nr:T9SS type A sorting domain-containing protein [Fibrella forsythiae]MBO0948918.1 T9SS type A sorting domain-containing protein [Fibrella forsythiae]
MPLHVRYFVLPPLLVLFYAPLIAQTVISTQALGQTSVCPTSEIDIPFSLSGTIGASNKFSIQFSRGSELTTLPASTVVGNPTTGQYTASVALLNLLATGTYKVRVVISNPTTVGSDSPTSLFIKTQPASAPTLLAQSSGNYTSQYTFCQNDSPLSLSSLVGPIPDNYRILYDQGTALASTSQRTFVAPVINPANVGRATYNFRYVAIDESKGCNLVDQPGSVSYLTTEIKIRPAAPSLSVSSFTYCQNQPATQIAATVTHAGADLTWYNSLGTPLAGSTLTPATTSAGTSVYRVTQSVDRCESAPASVSVIVRALSEAPTAPKTLIELCRGATAEPLMATGTNLIWTDPSGTTSTVGPIPSTLNASKTGDGDIYYVSQLSTNGCPSARLAIRVIVQASPTLSLSGGRNINLGIELPLQLSFTGTGPYKYQITTTPATTTLTGVATKDTTLLLLPTRSTVYQVTEVNNGCGVGLPGNPATATVVVLVPTIRTLTLQSATACAGSTITAVFQTAGTFNPGSVFRLQLAQTNPDSSKLIYNNLVITQQVGNSQLTGVLPATATSGTYLVRVSATNPKIPIIGTPSATTLTVLGPTSASMTTSTPAISDGGVGKLAIHFTGDGPWTFSYRDSTTTLGAIQTVTTATNPYLIDVNPTRTTSYQLTSLSNGCSLNTNIPGRVVITVSPLLAVEPLASLVTVFPVPATTLLSIQLDPSLLNEPATLLLLDEQGHTVLTKSTKQPSTPLSLAEQPAGVYLLQVLINGQKIVRRVVKQ